MLKKRKKNEKIEIERKSGKISCHRTPIAFFRRVYTYILYKYTLSRRAIQSAFDLALRPHISSPLSFTRTVRAGMWGGGGKVAYKTVE